MILLSQHLSKEYSSRLRSWTLKEYEKQLCKTLVFPMDSAIQSLAKKNCDEEFLFFIRYQTQAALLNVFHRDIAFKISHFAYYSDFQRRASIESIALDNQLKTNVDKLYQVHARFIAKKTF